MDGGGQRHAPAALPPGKARYPLYRRWVGPRTGMYGCGESRLTGIRSPDSPFWNKSLYRLSYPGPPCFKINLKIIGCTHNIVTDCVCMYVCMYVCMSAPHGKLNLNAKCIYTNITNVISGFHRALLQSITFISRPNALDYTKLRR